MPASSSDVEAATVLAQRIDLVGQGRVRRVVMIGSRALGTARKESDLDLVVLEEIPTAAPRWGLREVGIERARLQKAVGVPPIRTDLWVRTMDQYQEGRSVIGGIEHLVDVEGVTVFSRAPSRAPVIRRSPEQVRRDNVIAWIRNALGALDAAVKMESTRAVAAAFPPSIGGSEPARTAVERALNALLVLHQVRASKHMGVEGMLTSLASVDPSAAARITALTGTTAMDVRTAHRVLDTVRRHLGREPLLSSSLGEAKRHLATLATRL